MNTEALQLSISIAGLLIAVIGLPLIYLQLRGLQKSILTATHAAMYQQAAEFRAHLIQYPHLRKYFFDGWEIAPEDEEYSRVVTLAEIFLNYLDPFTGDWEYLAATHRHNDVEISIPGAVAGSSIRVLFRK